MLNDFELQEIDRLHRVIEEERGQMRALVEMLGAVGVQVWLEDGAITVVNEALESPYPIDLGAGYFGLGAAGT